MAQLDDIKGAMTRKFGPLPAWGWAGIAGGGIWWYRQHTGAGASSADGGTQAPAYVGPWGQEPSPIQGGAGIAGDGSGGGGGDTSGAGAGGGAPMGDMTNYPYPGAPTINVAAPPVNGGRPRHQKPKKQHTTKKPHEIQSGKGWKSVPKRGGSKSSHPKAGARGHQGAKPKAAAWKPVRPPRTQVKPPPKPPKPKRKVTRR